MIFVTIIAVLCSIGVCTHWCVSVGLVALAASVALSAAITARLNVTFARVAVRAAQDLGVAVNLPVCALALLCGFIGFTHADYNILLALGGFLSAGVAAINCGAIFNPPRMFFSGVLTAAIVGNGIVIVIFAVLAAFFHTSDDIGILAIFYGLAFVNANALAVKAAAYRRVDFQSEEGRKVGVF